MKKEKGKLFVVSGPSGVGKDTIVNEYLKNEKGHLSVSATTRSPRDGEIDGKDYYFLTEEEFKNWIKNDNFLEYAIYNNNYYGTPRSKIEESLEEGTDVFLVIEVQGAFQIKDKMKDAVLIFIMPPSLEELEKRIVKRGLDSKEMIQNRLNIAINEMNLSSKYDYVLVNKDLASAIEKFKLIIENAKEKN